MREAAPLKKVGFCHYVGSGMYFFLSPFFFTRIGHDLSVLYVFVLFLGYHDNEKQHIMLEPYGSILLHMFK